MKEGNENIDKGEEAGEITEIILQIDNPELVAALERKLEEYKNREIGGRETVKNGYKRAILGRLLRDGYVDVAQLLREMGEVHTKGIDMVTFNKALKVIHNYATGRADLNHGGTGLK